jgi:hypothetical protein
MTHRSTSYGNPQVHPSNQRVLKEAGQSQSRLCFALRVLQFLPDTQNSAGHARDGGRRNRSHMEGSCWLNEPKQFVMRPVAGAGTFCRHNTPCRSALMLASYGHDHRIPSCRYSCRRDSRGSNGFHCCSRRPPCHSKLEWRSYWSGRDYNRHKIAGWSPKELVVFALYSALASPEPQRRSLVVRSLLLSWLPLVDYYERSAHTSSVICLTLPCS